MLKENGVDYTYREYTQNPLSPEEIRSVLSKLGLQARDVLRTRDAVKAGLTGQESESELIELMGHNPRLLQRPIGVLGERAVVGRPVEALLNLLE